LPLEPPVWVSPLLLICLAPLLYLLRRRQGALVLVLFVLAASTGFGAVQWRAHAFAAPVLDHRMSPVDLVATAEKIEFRKNGLRLTLTDIVVGGLEKKATPRRIRLSSRFDQPDLHPGDRIKVLAVLLPPPEATMPGGFDFVRRAWFQQIGAVGFTLRKIEITAAASETNWRRTIAGVRQDVTRRILQDFPDNKVAGHLATALMTGHRGGVPEDVLTALRDAGLAHLLAISGLHMGLLASLIFFASRAGMALIEPLALRFPIKKFAALFALTGAFGYLLLTGGTVPTQRAFMMTGLVLVAVMLDRRAVSMGLVAWAAGAVLLLAPESLTGPSFQMSFAAVIALIAVYERSREKLSAWRRGSGAGQRVLLYILGVSLTTIVASLATSPVAVAHFGRLATWGLAANLIAVPVMAMWIMPWALVAFMLMPLGLEHLALLPMGMGINIVVEVAQTVAAWPGAVKILPSMPAYALAIMALGGLWLCLWRPPKATRFGLLPGGIGIVAGFVLWLMAAPPVVLIDGNAKLFGLVTQHGRLHVSNRRKSFTLRTWLAGQGLTSAEPLARGKANGGRTEASVGELRCDALGCLYQRSGRTIAIINDLRALAEDCPVSDVIVATLPLRQNCPQASIRIDRFDLWRNGAHALWVSDDGNIRVKSVAESRGQRLWSPARQRQASSRRKGKGKLAVNSDREN